MSFKGKVVLVTGASSGIGAETSIYFSKLGADLAITGRNSENLQKVSEKCAKLPFIVTGDLKKEEDARIVIECVINHFGRLDVLVNNAGIMEQGTVETANVSQYDRIFDVNVRSVYYLTYLAVPHLIKTKGNIVNVSSRVGIRPIANSVSYAMSKGAIEQFTKCTAIDLGPKKVRINSVNPGVIETDIFTRAGMTQQQIEALYESKIKQYPLARVGKPIDVAKAIAFFASDDAEFITGNSCFVDGGSNLVS